MAVRAHIFQGPPAMATDRHLLIRMTQCLLPDSEAVSMCIELAATYDQTLGRDDAAVGSWMALLIRNSAEPREEVERIMLACDLLRRSARTQH